MAEPISSAIGIKLSSTIAGFAGGIVSLAFIKGLTRFQAVMAVVVGALTANYLTPFAVYKLGVVQPQFQSGMAFVLGLCAMNIIPAIKAGAARFTQQAADKIDGGKRGDGSTS